MSSVVPIFYLYTALDVLALPETVPVSQGSTSIDPQSIRVTLFDVPSLEEVAGSGRSAVVTLMLSGTALQSRAVNSGEVLNFTTTLFADYTAPERGLIYARQVVGDTRDARRIDILTRLNSPDYEVIGLAEGEVPPASSRKTVRIEDDAMLRIPVREIVRHFASVFTTSATVVAPAIATFTNFPGAAITTFISLPEQAYINSGSVQQQSLLASVQPLQEGEVWQQPIKMSSTGWTVFGVLWGVLLVTCLLSVGITYGWYIAQYL